VKNHVDLPLRKIKEVQSTTAVAITASETSSTIHQTTSSFSLAKQLSPKSPLFVLSLPNSGSLALYRYFRCAGLSVEEIGKYFTNRREGTKIRDLETIGSCIHQNQQQKKQSLLAGCGNFKVWLDMHVTRKSLCHFLAMTDDGLEILASSYPNATILQVKRNPQEWYKTLSYDSIQRWRDLCQSSHPSVTFPYFNSGQEEWFEFYNQYLERIQTFIRRHPGLLYVEISLDQARESALTLQKHLGVDPQCWYDSISRPDVVPPRPNDITYPLLVTALSKSGTTTVHDYFTCGLGGGTSIHTWTKNRTTKEPLWIGACMEHNLKMNRPLLEDCSYYKVWSDIQYLDKEKGSSWSLGRCFVPSFEQNGGLQAFARDYPYGTLLHVVRNATAWSQSAHCYNNLANRWSRAKDCSGFPPPNSKEEAWVNFYQQHTAWVRRFAKEHSTLTYIEIQLEDPQTPVILEQAFGIPTYCWGHSNENRKIATLEVP